MAELLLPESAIGRATDGILFHVNPQGNEAQAVESEIVDEWAVRQGIRPSLYGLVRSGLSAVNAAVSTANVVHFDEVPLLTIFGEPNPDLINVVDKKEITKNDPRVIVALSQGVILLNVAHAASRFMADSYLRRARTREITDGGLALETFTSDSISGQGNGQKSSSRERLSVTARNAKGAAGADVIVFRDGSDTSPAVVVTFPHPIYNDVGATSVQVQHEGYPNLKQPDAFLTLHRWGDAARRTSIKRRLKK